MILFIEFCSYCIKKSLLDRPNMRLVVKGSQYSCSRRGRRCCYWSRRISEAGIGPARKTVSAKETLTDLILMKLLRVKQIEDNDGKTVVSEGIDANYMDIANYALFALILLAEGE